MKTPCYLFIIILLNGCASHQIDLTRQGGIASDVVKVQIAPSHLTDTVHGSTVSSQNVSITDQRLIADILDFLTDVNKKRIGFPRHDLKLSLFKKDGTRTVLAVSRNDYVFDHSASKTAKSMPAYFPKEPGFFDHLKSLLKK